MWQDNEIDMEELEARLYSQVYHSNEEEIPTSKPNIVQDDLTAKPHKRYFDGNGMHQLPYGSQSIHRVYQRHPNNRHTYFQAGENVDSHQVPLQYRDSTNFYNQMGLFPYPAVNNIVVLPQPPTQIFTQHQSAGRNRLRGNKRTLNRNERRKRAKEKWKVEQIGKGYKKHRKNVNLEMQNDTSNNSETLEDEIICLSESDSSDCEIEETQVPSIVVSSDDDDDDEMDLKDMQGDVIVEIKNEINADINNDTEKVLKQFGSKESVSSSTNKIENEDVPVAQKNLQSEAVSEDDDVIFIEPCQNEILNICDESQSLPDLNSSIMSNSIETMNDTVLTTVNVELLNTPESTNDFLDNSFNSAQNNIDASTTPKLSVNDFESDSNYSASDFYAPRSAAFTEQEFDVPAKEPFSELNLDSFTDYIASKASTSIPSILTPLNRSAGNMLKNNKSKDASLRNSSDSSSESDYDDNDGKVIQNRSKSKRKLNVDNKSSSSESDDCVINKDCNRIKNKSSLPNLSPITSDEETNVKINRKSNKNSNTKLKKNQKKTAQNVRVSGEKRKSACNDETFTEIKRTKQNEGDADLSKKSNEQQEASKFFSSSDSEVEVVRIDDESPQASIPNFDVELLNVAKSSTPIKQLRENTATKPKRFSDYWTDDMKKFYGESWGHENFNVEEEQKTMSDDPVMWKIINRDEIHFKLLPRGPRCYRCREFGHRANNCNTIIRPPKCILCGASGHLDARCPNKMCTSCGRKSHYSTTYCSRCADSRHVLCKICHMRGHSSSYCTDLWRRYHLTTTNGPLKQPTDSHLIPSKDRWCSGCASRGHFEFNCNYYNRTHPPADPHIYRYEDVYERNAPREQTQTSSFLGQPRDQSGNFTRPNQVSPWIFGCEPNMYNQRFSQNVVQSYGPNPNFYQQFPVFQSMKSIFDLQLQQNYSMNNIFYPNSDLISTNRGNQETYVPNTGPTTSQATEKNVVAKIVSKPNENESQAPLGENQKRDFLKLKDPSMRLLLSRAGLEFLKKLSKDFNVKIQIIKRKKNKKFSYWCMLEGAKEQMSKVKESVKSYCGDATEVEATQINVMQVFNGMEFSMQVLQDTLSNLDNPNTNWEEVAKKLYQKIKKLDKELIASKNARQLHKIQEFKDALKNHFIALNAILFGKGVFPRGQKEMRILREAPNNPQNKQLIKCYNYIFKRYERLQLNYGFAISRLSSHVSSKRDIDNLFQSGMAICKFNDCPSMRRLKYLYNNVIFHKYSQRCVDRLKEFYHRIKDDNEN